MLQEAICFTVNVPGQEAIKLVAVPQFAITLMPLYVPLFGLFQLIAGDPSQLMPVAALPLPQVRAGGVIGRVAYPEAGTVPQARGSLLGELEGVEEELLASLELELETAAELLGSSELELEAVAELLASSELELEAVAELLGSSELELETVAELLASSELELEAVAELLASSELELETAAELLLLAAHSEPLLRVISSKPLCEEQEDMNIAASSMLAANRKSIVLFIMISSKSVAIKPSFFCYT